MQNRQHSPFDSLLLKTTFSFAFLSLFGLSFSQTPKPDSVSALPFEAMYSQYMNRIGGAAVLYSGAEYEGAYPRILGSPFWKSNDFEKGAVCYEDIVYRDVQMAYDLVRNELVIKGFRGLNQRLEKAKVKNFEIAGSRFIHLGDSTRNESLPDDYYHLLFDGAVRAYAKRGKYVSRAFAVESLDSIASTTAYFLQRGEAYFRIEDDKDLLTVFRSEKDALKRFWKERKLNFKKEPETFLTQTLDYWERTKK